MKTYEEAILYSAIMAQGPTFCSCRSVYRSAVWVTLGFVYQKAATDVAADLNEAEQKLLEAEKKARKEKARLEHEARRQVNIASGNHREREPKQRKLDLGSKH